MRTTLTLEPDVEKMIRDETHRTRKSFKAVVNDAIRNGLAARMVVEPQAPYKLKPKTMGLRPGIDPMKLQQLGDDLEAEHCQSLSQETDS